MASPPAVPQLSHPLDVTISDGQSLSSALSLFGRVPTAILMPVSWTAANITFQTCATIDGTFLDLYGKDGAELTVTMAESRAVALDVTNFFGINFLKVRSGTTGSPVPQSGDISFQIMLGKPLV